MANGKFGTAQCLVVLVLLIFLNGPGLLARAITNDTRSRNNFLLIP